MSMCAAPKGIRLHIGIFGRRNVGKSSLLNAITRQQVAIVSDQAGTTTDPVEKPMELLPLGPVLFIDTAGIDDVGALGELRIQKTKKIFFVFTALALAALLGGCAGGPATKAHDFTPQDLNPLIRSGQYVQNVDSFLVVLDASGTMYGTTAGHRKVDLAKGVISRMDRTIPDLKLTSGLRSLGQNYSAGTRLAYGMTDYAKGSLEGAAGPITGGGSTPLAAALNACGGDLQSAPGKMPRR